ncbi:MAG: efflux RND transporter periplasmic adaptor subunit, partial [Candidatus Zixiibacteriota bacterium]
MNEDKSMQGLIRRPVFWITIAIVTVAAFSFGVMISSGGSSPTANETATQAKQAEVWTCSMHPQIKLPKPGKCPICFMDLIPLESGAGDDTIGVRQLRMSETSKKLAQIETSPVKRGSAERELHLYGKISADEARLENITARVGGRIDRLFVNTTGQDVRRGEKMIELYSPELLSAQKELLQARASQAKMAQSNSDILKSTAEATVAAAKEKLRLLGFTDEQIGKIESQAEVTEHLTITAPAGGTVIEKMVVEGQYVEMGMDMLKLADLSKLWVVLEAYESDVAFLKIGDEVTFTTQSYPGETFAAEVIFINPTLDPMSRTVAVRAVVDNADGRLKPDMFVDATLVATSDKQGGIEADALLAPVSAVLITGKRAVVY